MTRATASDMIATILLDGAAYGMVLFLISAGLTVTMGLMRVVNLAHGAFAMFGGYLGVTCLSRGLSFWTTIAVVGVATAMLGFLVERVLYRPLYRKGELAQLLMTFGLTFVSVGCLTYVFGPGAHPVNLPPELSGTLDLGFRRYSAYRIFLIGFGVLLALAMWMVIDFSSFGMRLRAAVDNFRMAKACGVNVTALLAATFASGCAIAGIGGFIGAGVLPLEPFYALKYLSTFLFIVALGGLGSFKGSFVAAMVFGSIDTAGKYLLPSASPYIPYLIVIVVLLLFPEGILRSRNRR